MAVSAVLSLPAVVNAQATGNTFSFVTLDIFVGNAPDPGNPIDVVGGLFRQDPNGSNFPPTPSLLVDFPSVEFDTYVALDPIGPTTPQHAALPPDGEANLIFTPNSVSGHWFSNAGVISGQGPFPGEQSVFIGRFAVSQGARLFAPEIAAFVTSQQFGQKLIRQPLQPPLAAGSAPPTASFADRGGGSAYDFRSVFSSVGIALAPPGQGDRGIVVVDIFDVYIVAAIPPCFGDANGDGIVDFSDITTVLGNWLKDYTNTPTGTGPGDANFDGVVNFSDITTVLGNWLRICP